MRRTAAVCLLCALAASAAGQSNVMPVADLAMPPVSALALARAPAPAAGATARPGSSASVEAPPAPAPKEDELAELRPVRIPDEATRLTIEVDGLFMKSSELSNGAGGEVALQRGSWKASLATELSEDTVLGLQLGAEASFYDFGGSTGLVPGADDPFNDLYRTSLGASLYSQSSASLGWFAGIDATLAGEDEADLGDAAILGGVAGLRYSDGDDRSVSLGIAVLEKLEGSPWVFPYLGLDVLLGEGTRLTFEGSRGSLSQDLGEKWRLNLDGSYELRQYRLNPDGPLPDGVFRDDQILVSLGIERHDPGGLGLELKVGGSVWQELDVRDSGGNPVGLSEVEPTAFVQLGLSLGF
jgi:hypothetical protein